jgi:hypothetical protein
MQDIGGDQCPSVLLVDGPLSGTKWSADCIFDNEIRVRRPGKRPTYINDPEPPPGFEMPIYDCRYHVYGNRAYYIGEVLETLI